MHQGQGEASVPSPDPASPIGSGLPAAFTPKTCQLAVPSNEQFQVIRAEARETGKTHEVHRAVSVMQTAAGKLGLVFSEQVRLAVFRLQLERDLGVYLVQHVHRGGDRANDPEERLLRDGGLPKWVTPKKAAAYRKLAAIPEAVFQGYVEEARKKGKMPSSKGARDFASTEKQPVARPKYRTAKAAQDAISADLLDACVRCLGQIDVLVGKAKVKAAVNLDPKDDLTKKARGTVFVVGAPDPEAVLRAVAKVRRAGAIDEAIVILPRDIDQAWFAALGAGPWSCCVPREVGTPIVAHIGGHARGFSLVFAQLGVVMTVEQAITGDRRE